MGISPTELGRTSLWEFTCAYAGWMRAQGASSEEDAPTDDDHEAMIEAFKAAQKKEADSE